MRGERSKAAKVRQELNSIKGVNMESGVKGGATVAVGKVGLEKVGTRDKATSKEAA